MQRSLVLVKPDGVMRRLTGRIITRFEEKGLSLVAAKLIRVTPELAARHYEEHKARPFYDSLISFITSGPVLAMVWSGDRAVDVIRNVLGETDGGKAPPGTIRGDYGLSKQYNLVHASDSEKSAAREVALFFKETELVEYRLPDQSWIQTE